MAFVFLCGCGRREANLDRVTALREKMLSCEKCSFTAQITADYGDKIYDFTMDCIADKNDDLSFTVVEPKSIEGIKGSFNAQGGELTFDDIVLTFPKLADGELSPVSAPWLIVKTLLGGYLSSCGMDDHGLRVTIDDTYEEDALQLDLWLNEQNAPYYVEILWQGRRILTVNVDNFVIL